MSVYTGHAAVKAVLQTPNRRVKMPDGGVKCTRMVTRPSRVEQFQCRCIISCTCRTCSDDEIHVAAIQSKDISDFLRCDAERLPEKDLTEKQRRDPSVQEMIAFLETPNR